MAEKPAVFELGLPVSGKSYPAWAVQKGNSELAGSCMNEFMAEQRANGTIAKLQEKWFGQSFPDLPTSLTPELLTQRARRASARHRIRLDADARWLAVRTPAGLMTLAAFLTLLQGAVVTVACRSSAFSSACRWVSGSRSCAGRACRSWRSSSPPMSAFCAPRRSSRWRCSIFFALPTLRA